MTSSASPTTTFEERLDKRMAEFPIREESINKRRLFGDAREAKLARDVLAEEQSNKFGSLNATIAKELHRDYIRSQLMQQEKETALKSCAAASNEHSSVPPGGLNVHADSAAASEDKAGHLEGEQQQSVVSQLKNRDVSLDLAEAHRVLEQLRAHDHSVYADESAIRAVYTSVDHMNAVIAASKQHLSRQAEEQIKRKRKSDTEIHEDAPPRKRIACKSTVHVVKVRMGNAECKQCKTQHAGWSVLEGYPLRISCDLCNHAVLFDESNFSA
jgi:hypothetical protein